MKAVVYESYGSPNVLQLKEIPKPHPKANEVLIKITATSVNRTDCGFRKPEYPVIIRLINGIFKPKKQILGSEFSGIIEAIGNDATLYKVGDPVFGLSTNNFGTHAEYICLPENGSFSIKPNNISFEEAGAVSDGVFLALTYIREIDFSQHPKILINGASGSIGSACLQLAKFYGSHVTAVCQTKSVEIIKILGADDVIDYLKEDFTQRGQYDYIIDAVGKSSYFKCLKILKPHAKYFSTELGFLAQNIFLAIFTPLFCSKKVLFPIPKDCKADIEFLKNLIELEKYKPLIDKVFTLDQIIEATQYVELGQKIGNVAIKIEQ